MYDRLPFLCVRGNTPEEKINEIADYLYKLKEALEFELISISAENLSNDLIDKLNGLGADIEKTVETTENHIQQVNKSPTISVNYETGYLEYK